MRSLRVVLSIGVLGWVTSACDEEPVALDAPGQPPAQHAHIGAGETALQPLPGADDVRVRRINAAGHVIGTSGGRGVLWENGVPRELPFDPSDINVTGRVVSTMLVDGLERAVVWEDGVVTALEPLPGHERSQGIGISDAGHVVGVSVAPTGEAVNVVWYGGQTIQLTPLPGHDRSRAYDVSSSGLVIGVSGSSSYDDFEEWAFVVWRDGQVVWDSHSDPAAPYPGNNGWVGITEEGVGFFTNIDAGDVSWVWRDGDVSRFLGQHYSPWRYLRSVAGTADELASGYYGEYEGVWRNEVFLTLDTDLASRCDLISAAEHLVCSGPGHAYPFVTTVSAVTGGPPADSVADLGVASTTASSVTLTWTQVDDGTGGPGWYELRYDAGPVVWHRAAVGCGGWMEGDEVGAVMSCTVTGLQETIYGYHTFQVMSFRNDGGRVDGPAFSATVRGVLAPPESGPVDDLAVAGAGRTTLEVTWTQVDDGEGDPARYRLKYATPSIEWSGATKACDVVGDGIGAEASCTVAALDPGTAYELQLMSYRLDESGAWIGAVYSNVASGTTHAADAPGPVDDLHATAVTWSSATLTWTQVNDGTGGPASYEVRYGAPPLDWASANVACEVAGTDIGAEASCVVDGLDPETAYELQLVSHPAGATPGDGDPRSNVVSVETPLNTAHAVSDLAIAEATRHTLTVSWTQVDDGTGAPARYRLKYAPAPIAWSTATVGCDPNLVGDQIGSEMSCTIEGLDAATAYDVQLMSYRIEAGAWVGAVYSNVATGETDDATEPGAVDDLTASSTTWSSVTLSWTQVDGGDGNPASYQLRYAEPSIDWATADVACDGTLEGTQVGAEMSCAVDGLTPTTTYDFQVASFPHGAGPGAEALYSSVLSATTACKYDGARVTDLGIIGTTETTIYLRWTEVNDVTHHPCASVPAWYRVKYAVSPMGSWAEATIGCDPTIEGVQVGAEMRCLITDLEPETTYDVQLMSFHQEDGVWTDALYSNLVTGVTVDSPGGIPGN